MQWILMSIATITTTNKEQKQLAGKDKRNQKAIERNPTVRFTNERIL